MGRTLPTPAQLPSFRLGSAIKETHGHPVYCVAWSSDLYLQHEREENRAENPKKAVPTASEEEKAGRLSIGSTASSTMGEKVMALDFADGNSLVESGEGGAGGDGGDKKPTVEESDQEAEEEEFVKSNELEVVVKASEPPTDDEKGQNSSSPPSRKRHQGGRVLRCLATCGGNHITVYEIEASNVDVESPKGGAAPRSTSGNNGELSVRQAYVDPDVDELFFSCAFGGNSLGSGFGHEPLGETVEVDEAGGSGGRRRMILLTADEDEDEVDEDEQEEDDSSDDNLAMQSSASPSPSSDGHAPNEGGAKGQHTGLKRRRNSQTNDDTPPCEIEVTVSPNADQKPLRRRADARNAHRNLYRTLTDLSTYDGPQLLCVGGRRGIIKVIDTVRRTLLLTLSGHGDEIYDMKFHPNDPWLLLTASKDESLRLWNVKTATCVAIFAGHEGHRDSVLSVDWHCFGDRFASSGMDTTVKLWFIGEGTEVADAVEESYGVKAKWRGGLGSSERKKLKKDGASEEGKGTGNDVFGTIYEQMPYFSTNKVHTDYVDCVQFVGDLVLSKSIADTIVLWKPDLSPKPDRGSKSGSGAQRLPNRIVALREFTLNNCDVWYVRFQTDADCRLLAIGNNGGEVKVWEIGGSSFNPSRKHFANLTNQLCGTTVRMVSFSPDGRCLVAACDDSTVWKWDAM